MGSSLPYDRTSTAQQGRARRRSKPMKKASEYRQHAEECRALARTTAGEQRDKLLGMAETWDKLAAERAERIWREPKVAEEGEHAEEVELSLATRPRTPAALR